MRCSLGVAGVILTIVATMVAATAAGAPALSLEKIGEYWFMHNTPARRPQ